MSVSEILRNWGLEVLIDTFTVKGIDRTTLQEVDGSFLEGLIPDINLRWRFVRQRAAHGTLASVDLTSTPNPSVSASSRPGSSLSVSAISEDATVSENVPEDNISIDLSEKESSPRKRANSDPILDSQKKKPLVDVDSYVQSVSWVAHSLLDVTGIQLVDVLRSSACGRWILNSYEVDKHLSHEARSDLIDILVAELLNITTSPTPDEYSELVRKVIEIFPTEVNEVYYEPAKKSGPHQKLARGKLFDKLRGKKARYGLCSSRTNIDSETTANTSTSDGWVLSEETAKAVDFLAKWQEPEDEVNKYWAAAAPHRLRWLNQQDECERVADYLKIWPHLKHPVNGPKLIGIDFELSTHVGEDKGDLLVLKWDTFIKCLKVIVSKKKITSKQDSEGKEIITALKRKDINDFESEAMLLELLPSLITANRFVTIGSGDKSTKIKPSIVEVRLAFVTRVNAAGDLNTKIRQLKERMAKVEGHLQPFIAIVGVRPNISSIYVCLDSHLYKVKTIQEAVDLCFKTFFALNCHYPSESEHLWQFVQRYFFGIKVPKQVNIAAVTTFITSLDANK